MANVSQGRVSDICRVATNDHDGVLLYDALQGNAATLHSAGATAANCNLVDIAEACALYKSAKHIGTAA
jgi:hypothetical protein